jgi:uncharacterized membrane protein
MKRVQILFLVELSILAAIEIIFCFTPLGSLPVSPGIVATLAHIPAIVAALILGKKGGAIIGGVMGISALIIWTFIPPNPLVAFAFSPFAPNGNIFSLLIVLLPRILFPVIVAWLYIVLKKRMHISVAAALAAGIGTAAHTLMVLSGIYLAFHGNAVIGGAYVDFIIAWAGVNAIIEILAAVIVAAAVVVPLEKIKSRQNLVDNMNRGQQNSSSGGL